MRSARFARVAGGAEVGQLGNFNRLSFDRAPSYSAPQEPQVPEFDPSFGLNTVKPKRQVATVNQVFKEKDVAQLPEPLRSKAINFILHGQSAKYALEFANTLPAEFGRAKKRLAAAAYAGNSPLVTIFTPNALKESAHTIINVCKFAFNFGSDPYARFPDIALIATGNRADIVKVVSELDEIVNYAARPKNCDTQRAAAAASAAMQQAYVLASKYTERAKAIARAID